MPNRLRRFPLVASIAAAALLTFPTAAHTQTVPIQLRYAGSFTAPTVVSFDPLIVHTTDQLAGVGSHLGSFTAEYPHLVNFTAGTFAGTATFTAANGDLLMIKLGGTGSPTSETTFAIELVGTIAGGTDRFEDASAVSRARARSISPPFGSTRRSTAPSTRTIFRSSSPEPAPADLQCG